LREINYAQNRLDAGLGPELRHVALEHAEAGGKPAAQSAISMPVK
jgi:hypothetical protein